MQIFLKTNELHCVQVDSGDLVSNLKAQINAIEGIATEDQVLSYNGITLDDDLSLEAAGLNDLSTVQVLGRVLGGKVHGSLARAGKVKGQTPKVEAQEKKKKKTGRAKRRMQYNRRFVNVVATFGRRRGPNANS
uniref:Ubiquitin-like protein FUBI n=1 Tax=Ciona intestinalis TaxID=7719 RepID=F6YRC1_CIOIN|nr:ubiquitin-like protein FUBI [Ciona intestinalis]|eukprot:XP_009859868.1 ubiquitin-like protein FUBI [Ciona intestinalis]